MKSGRPSGPEKQRLISSFLEIAAEQTQEIAQQFLQATGWKLEEALQLFYVGSEGVAVAGSSSTAADAAEDGVSLKEEDAINGFAVQDTGEEEVRAPLPVKREALYDDSSAFYRLDPSAVVAFRNFEEESKQVDVWDAKQNDVSTPTSSRDNLASLYRPPFGLMHNGPFDKAKVEASIQDKWLLVNLQSTQEFSSHMLNRDTWSNEAVEQTIRSNFIFWQVYNDTSEGKKVCTYYNLVSVPAVLVIDPITGQKMRTWSGMVHPERLLEDLLPYLDRGPKEHHVPPARKRTRENPQMSASVEDKLSEEDEQIRRAIAAASLEDRKKQKFKAMEEPALEEGVTGEEIGNQTVTTNNDEESKMEKDSKGDAIASNGFLPLPDEPHGDRTVVCRVAIKLPDGRRLQRNFLLRDPIQLLWPFCCLHLEEAKTQTFRFTHAIPRSPRFLEYESQLTFAEAGLSNSMILLVWE